MPLIPIVITLIVVGILLYLVETYIPMDAAIKNIIRIVVILIVVLWLLSVTGMLGYLGNVRAPVLR